MRPDTDRETSVISDRNSDLSVISGSDRDLCEACMQVNSISFFEHHVLEGDGETSGRSDAAAAERLRRECVMEAEVTNRTDGPLQVIICTRFCLLSRFTSSSLTSCCSCRTAQMQLYCCFSVGHPSVKDLSESTRYTTRNIHNMQYTACNPVYIIQYNLQCTVQYTTVNVQVFEAVLCNCGYQQQQSCIGSMALANLV